MFIIFKISRMYNGGVGYTGPAGANELVGLAS